MRAGNKRRLFIEERAEVFGREERGRRGGGGGGSGGGCGGGGLLSTTPPFYGVVLEGGEAVPGGDVGFVVEGGEDEGGVGGEGEDEGEVGEELGCGGADYWRGRGRC